MYKTDIVRKVARETRLSQRIVTDVLDTSHKVVQTALKEGQEVTFSGWWKYYTRERKPSTVRDIRSGKEVKIPQMRVAAFRVGEVLKKAVRSGKPGKRKKKLFGL